MSYCKNCGAEISENLQFCSSCGQRIETNQSSDAQEPISNTYMSAINSSDFNTLQKSAVICAAISALCFLCTFTRYWDWIAFFASAFLAFLCIKKEHYDTEQMAIPLTALMGKELILYAITKLRYFAYFSASAKLIGIISFLIEASVVVIYWLVVKKNVNNKKAATIFNLIVIGLLSAGSLLTALSAVRFTNVTHQLGLALFLAVYFMLILSSELNESLKDKYVSTYNSNNVSTSINDTGEGSYCAECGAFLKKGTKFCGECGNKIEE